MGEMTRRAFLGVFAVGIGAAALGGAALLAGSKPQQPKEPSFQFANIGRNFQVGDYITLSYLADKDMNGTYRFEADGTWRKCGWHPYD